MYVIETRYLPSSGETLVVSPQGGRVQSMMSEGAVLCEWQVPILYQEQSFSKEVSITIDDTFLYFSKLFPVMKIDDKVVDFGGVVYGYEQGDIFQLESRLPDLVGILVVDKMLDIQDECCQVKTFKDDLVIYIDNYITIKQKLFFKVKDMYGDVSFNFQFLKKIFEKHIGETCMVYLESDFPICLEFKGTNIIRYYVAPMSDGF